MRGLQFHPVLPWPWLAVLLPFLAAGIGWSLFTGVRSRKRVTWLGLLRAAAFAALALMLSQPERRRDEVTILRPQLAVLIDNSESMTDPADGKQPRRAERVREWLRSPALEQARKDFDVRFFSFDRGLNELSGDPAALKFNGGASSVVASLGQAAELFRGQPLAGILLLSDGLDTTDAKAATALAGVSVDAFELEKPFKPRPGLARISLANVDYPPRVVIGWETQIRASLTATGMSGHTVGVELWRDGIKQGESAAAFNEDDQTREVTFPISEDKPGSVQYEIRVPDVASDKEARSYPFVIQVLEPGNRVLYIQNALGFDFKFLRKAIVTDRNLQLSAYVRWSDGSLVNVADQGARTPLDLSAQSLAGYAVILLGDLPPAALSQEHAQAIRDFVDRGGGLVLLGGPNFLGSPELANTPLGRLLPVTLPAEYREGNFPVEITDTGLHHPVFGPLFMRVKDFPPLLTCNTAAGVSPNAEVLMQVLAGGAPRPLVVSTRFGQGRVIVLLTDTMWRWRLAARGWSAERSPYDTFWTQLMDWLIPKDLDKDKGGAIELFTERSNYAPGEKPEVRAILRAGGSQPASLPLHLRTPDDKVFEYTLHPAELTTSSGKRVAGYRCEVEPSVPGLYKAVSSTTVDGKTVEGETRFVVARPATELTGKPIDRKLLRQIAAQNQGRFYDIEDWNKWREGLHFKEQHFSRVELSDLWNQPLLLGFLMALLACDWLARKFWNLP